MKIRIAVILIFISEIFAALLVGTILIPNESCGIKDFTTPPYFTPSLLIIFVLLLIAACILWRKTTKTVWFSCLTLAAINLGIMCWSAIYYLGIHCDGLYQITPNTGLANISIIAAAIITLSLLLLFSDINCIIRTPSAGNVENKTASSFPVIAFVLVILIPITMLLMYSCSGGVYGNCKRAAYDYARKDIQNAVTEYMAAANHSSQLPIISSNATFTLTHPNGSYYIINMSPLLVYNGGLLREVPDGCIALTGPDNDNCDGGINGCDDTFHYIWGVDNQGKIASKPVNIEISNELQCNACDYCQCDTCDGYQDIWP